MIAHHYNALGEYTGSWEAPPDPEEDGQYLIPAQATTVPPPEPQDGFMRVFDGAAWGYVAIVGPEPEPTPEPVVTAEMINLERDRRLLAGRMFGTVYLTANESFTLSEKAMGASIQPSDPELIEFRDAANVHHWLSQEQVVDLWQQWDAWRTEVYSASWGLKDLDPIPLDFTANAYWPDPQEALP